MYVIVLILLLISVLVYFFFFFKHKTAYELRISDWSSDVCSSDLASSELEVQSRRECPRRAIGGPSIVDRGKSVHDKGFVQGVGDREPQAYLFRRIRDGYRPVQHDVGFLVCKADVEEIIAVIGGRGIEGQVCAAEAVLIRGRQRAGEVLRQW